MSGLVCPHCGKSLEVFGRSRAEEVSRATGIRLLGRLPLDPELSKLADQGAIEKYPIELLKDTVRILNGL